MMVAPRDGPYAAAGRTQDGDEKGGGRTWGLTISFKASWLS